MKKNIGGEFLIDPSFLRDSNNDGFCIEENARYYSLGRTALYAVLSHLKNEDEEIRLLIPDYLCASIVMVINQLKINYNTYNISKNFEFDIEDFPQSDSHSAILLINYFGLIDIEDNIKKIKQINPNGRIIVDNVQAYFSSQIYDGIDFSFTSMRKWFPVPDGAMVFSQEASVLYELHEFKGENGFYKYKLAGNILKNYIDETGDEIALELIKKGEEIADKKYICRGSNVSKKIMSHVDMGYVKDRRKKNAQVLHEGLNKLGVPHKYNEKTVPLFVPIFIQGKRDEIRKSMFMENIFCPVHWGKHNNLSNELYDIELSLVCDQRYDENDMRRELEVLKRCL